MVSTEVPETSGDIGEGGSLWDFLCQAAVIWMLLGHRRIVSITRHQDESSLLMVPITVSVKRDHGRVSTRGSGALATA